MLFVYLKLIFMCPLKRFVVVVVVQQPILGAKHIVTLKKSRILKSARKKVMIT